MKAGSATELARRLRERFPELVTGPVEFRSELTLGIADAERVPEICGFAKVELGFDYLVDITSLDNYGADPRFTLVYHLYSHGSKSGLRLKTDLSEEKGEAPTVTGIWRTADWHEREIFDMMGIRFRGHPDLRRIIMWDGYPYFPLRKDFPLSGKPTDLPEIAFTDSAPLVGGPFVTVAGGKDTRQREPRVRIPEPDLQPASVAGTGAEASGRTGVELAQTSASAGKEKTTEWRGMQIPDTAARGAELAQRFGPTSGESGELGELEGDKMILNMGPSHPSTHGVLRIILELDGEVIAKAMPDVGYLHRGDEKIAENMTYTQFIPYTDRLDYLAPLANNVAYALAVEKLLGIDRQLPPRCQYIRVICAELARISSHLLGLGSYAMDVGAMTVFLLTFTEREKIYSLCEALTGARFTTSYTRIGGLARDLPPGWVDQCRKFLKEVVVNIDETETLLNRNRIFVDRTQGVGAIEKADALDYGLTGPNLRGSGVEHDLRKTQPYLVYDQLEFDVPVGSAGDSYDRYLVRLEEMRQSVRIVHQCLDQIPDGPVNVPDMKISLPPKDRVLTRMEELIHHFINVTQGVNAPPGEIYFGHENPKGELGFYINSKGGGTPYRLKIRSPSFVNLSILPKLLPGHMVSDVVTILGSFDFVMGECDR